VIKAQFKMVSPDDKTIKDEDFIKVMKGCKQNPSQKDIDNAMKELKFETKAQLNYDETYMMAKHLWNPSPKKLTQEEKDRMINFDNF
jgi:hypothetical protein